MGSFNVACSASNISINSGDKVAFFLLNSKKDYFNKEETLKIPTRSKFLDSDSFYEPVALPIFGQYNDYGSIENIVHDSNTKIIEQKYNLKIEQIIDLLTDGREPLEAFSETFSIFGIKDFGFGDYINNKNLKEYGFEETIPNSFIHKLAKTSIILEKTKNRRNCFDIMFIKDGYNTKINSIDSMGKLQTIMFSKYDYIISLPPEKQNIIKNIKFLKGLSSMFVHKDIYDTFVSKRLDGNKNLMDNLGATPIPEFFKALGFKFIKKGKQNQYIDRDCSIFEKDGLIAKVSDFGVEFNDNKSKSYYMKDAFSFIEKNTNVILDKSKIVGINSLKESILDKLEELSSLPSKYKERDENESKILEEIIKNNILDKLKPMISINRYNNNFTDLYFPELISGNDELLDIIVDFKSFYWTFYSTNHMFMPAMNGEQFGNAKLSSLLYKKANLVLNNSNTKFSEDIPSYYLETEDIKKCISYLNELIEDYDDPSSISGLSKFEISLFKKDNNILEEILSYYI